jgi:hypothetical protein
MRPLCIIIAGPPASGKTTLGQRLAHDFKLPFLHRDGIKAVLFDALAPQQREPLARLGYASTLLLYTWAEALLAAGQGCIIEAGFEPSLASQELQQLQQRCPFEPFQIQCFGDGPILLERFRARMTSGTRHLAHPDEQYLEYHLDSLLRGRWAALDIGGRVFELNTTDFTTLDYQGLCAALTHALYTTKPDRVVQP